MSLRNINLVGAITAQIIYLSSIATFIGRMYFHALPGHWLGTPLLLMGLPLLYLLWTAPKHQRPPLYYLQTGLMLSWIVLLFLLDYLYAYEFRHTRWMVIGFVTWYFAAMGGMIGVAALVGRAWMIASIVLFFIAGILAFVQRAVTGL